MSGAVEKLIREERAEEKRKNQAEIATNLIKAGNNTDEQIASACGLKLSDVQKLREGLTAAV